MKQGVVAYHKWITFDEYNREAELKQDNDGDGVVSSSTDQIIKYISYDSVWGDKKLITEIYDGSSKLTSYNTHQYDALGNLTLKQAFWGQKNEVDVLEFGEWGGFYTTNHTEDLTKWSETELTKLNGLRYVVLSSPAFSSTLILNKGVLEKIAPQKEVLIIRGDATDTVDFQDTKLTKIGTETLSWFNGSVDKYEAELSSGTFTFYVQPDIDVNGSAIA